MRQNRRQFVRTTTLAAAAAAFAPATVPAADPVGVAWPIGCFNRPWVNAEAHWTLDTALDGIRDAGYRLAGLLTPSPGEPLIAAEATAEYLAGVKAKIAARGLRANLGALRLATPLVEADAIKSLRQQIDHAQFLGLEYLLTFGVNQAADYETYYRAMADAAAYSQERGLRLVLKPHGGGSGAAEEITRCLEKVRHPNFKVWYDAGNIIYYTGKDPLEQLKPIAQHVTGFCAKDCDRPHGEVFLAFGTGKVDFAAVFHELKQAGFHGPVMVECCAKPAGATPAAITAAARQNRAYLEKLFSSL